MVEYSVLFAVKMSAKNVKDLQRKAEKTGEQLSKCLKKKVYPYQYGELKKEDKVQSTLTEGAEWLDIELKIVW